MTSNDTTDRGSVAGLRRGGDARPLHVVLVADADSTVTDQVADALRESYVVRTAHSDEDLMADLDEDVSAVLLDPTLAAAERVLDALAADAGCRVAALVESPPAIDERFDEHLRKPVSRSALRSTVDRLCCRVSYRDALDRYFDLAQARASLAEDDSQRERLAERLAAVEAELDEAALPLDSDEIYEAALRGQ